MSLCFGAGTGESWGLKIYSFSPVHSREPASSTDKFEQLTEGLSSSWWLWFYHSNPPLLLSPILLLLSWLPFKDQHAGSLIWKLINFSLCHVSSLVGDQGLISLRNVLFYVVSAQRESQVKGFFEVEHWACPTVRWELGGSGRGIALLPPTLLGEGLQTEQSVFYFKLEIKRYVSLFGLDWVVSSASVSNICEKRP